MDLLDNGAFYYVNARTHHMDSLMIKFLKAGFRQVVIMGAGFDSRAYRFHEAYPDVRFFEIDLPATSADKQHRVETLIGQKPDWVAFVPIDFNTQTLDEVLGKAGLVADQQTFYIWEGVTYFISQSGVDNTLDFIAEKSAPGSRIIFDYMLEMWCRALITRHTVPEKLLLCCPHGRTIHVRYHAQAPGALHQFTRVEASIRHGPKGSDPTLFDLQRWLCQWENCWIFSDRFNAF